VMCGASFTHYSGAEVHHMIWFAYERIRIGDTPLLVGEISDLAFDVHSMVRRRAPEPDWSQRVPLIMR
jgi:hypothetical protein